MLSVFRRSFTKTSPKAETEIASTIEAPMYNIRGEEGKKIFISNEKANKMFARGSQMIDEYLQEDILELFSEAPLFLKIKFVLHAFNLSNVIESNIDWNKINEFIFSNPIPYDYNIDLPGVIITIDDLKYLDSMIFMALKDVKPFYRSTCKGCNNDFDLNYGEIKFYVANKLCVPKKCTNCRKSR